MDCEFAASNREGNDVCVPVEARWPTSKGTVVKIRNGLIGEIIVSIVLNSAYLLLVQMLIGVVDGILSVLCKFGLLSTRAG